MKRALLSLKSKITKNILLTVAFTVLFTVILSSAVIFNASQKQVEKAKNNLANAVTLRGVAVDNKGWKAPTVKAVESFLESEYVEGYSLEGNAGQCVLKNAKAFYKHDYSELSGPGMAEFLKRIETEANVILVSDSERCRFFTMQGYELVKGKPLMPYDTSLLALVTEEFAELNGLDVGDELILESPDKNVEIKTIINGLYKLPEEIYNAPILDEYAHNYVFLTYEPYRELFSEHYSMDEYSNVTAFLKDTDDIDLFIEEVDNKLNILAVTDHLEKNSEGISAEGYISLTSEEYNSLVDKNKEGPYQIILDRDWFEMVAKPLQNVNHITLILTVSMIFGAVLILIFISVININARKKEIGILVAIGESRIKIFVQLCIEMFVPILLALTLSVFISSAITRSFSDYLIEQNSAETIEDNADKLSDLSADREEQTLYSVMAFMTRDTLYIEPDTKLNVAITPPLIIIFVIGIIDIVLLSLFIQLLLILKMKPREILLGKR